MIFKKILSPTDLGERSSRSHQQAILVPKESRNFFPKLSTRTLNPSQQIELIDINNKKYDAVYTHYNDKLLKDGFKDETRIRAIANLVKNNNIKSEDQIVLEKKSANEFYFNIIRSHDVSHNNIFEKTVSKRSQVSMLRDPNEYESVVEGTIKKTIVNKKERSPKLREACIAIHGYRCAVCRKTFEDIYGKLGKDFIEVHHKDPISKGKRATNPLLDLIPVCSNCHKMLHHKTNKPRTIEGLQSLLVKKQ